MLNFAEKRRISEENRRRLEEERKIYNENVRKMDTYIKLNTKYNLEYNYNSIIPLHLYTCWHNKELPPLMKQNYDFMKNSNPKITFHLYDEDECREFIKIHFKEDVLDAYDMLIPCAYKADLWRYCVLFINGGIYMDIKYSCVNGFKLIALTEKEHFVKDRPENCIYNALISVLPKNTKIFSCIRQIVENVKNQFYGENPLEPTGPKLLGKYFSEEETKNIPLYFQTTEINNTLNEFYIVFNDRIVLRQYKGYRDEQLKCQKNLCYSKLWENKDIYKK